MTAPSGSDPRYEEIVQRLGGALRAARLYSPTHPSVGEHVHALVEAVRELQGSRSVVLLGFVGGEVIADDTLLVRATATRGDLAREMQALGIHRLLFERGVTRDEVATFVREVASRKERPHNEGRAVAAHSSDDLNAPKEAAEVQVDFLALPHLRAGRIPVDVTAGRSGSGALGVRRVYSDSVDSARTVWDSATSEGRPDLPIARETVEHLAEAVGTSDSLMIGLTGIKEHDNYTFTHMVNTSILAMAQARSLGIVGDQLRVIGLAAFLHDVGKVRTPLEILNKPGALTPGELEVMRRHPLDGAAILRATREMPRLAAVVAFEHHLRQDGVGYPRGLPRLPLNLATVLCGIADVYDAMRSQRCYHRPFATDRILEIIKSNDGKQFDQHLVRRFIHLVGLYPPATLVRLTTGEVAVVAAVDGSDPALPTVRVLTDCEGTYLPAPETRSLWRTATADPGDHEPVGIAATLDPAAYNIDPISILRPA